MKYTDDGKELGASKIATIMLGWGPFDSPEDLRINAQHAQAGVEVLDTNRWAEASERGNELEISLGEWAVKKLQRMAAGVAITASRPQQGYFKGTTALDKIGSSLDFLLDIRGELFIPDYKQDLLRLEGEGPPCAPAHRARPFLRPKRPLALPRPAHQLAGVAPSVLARCGSLAQSPGQGRGAPPVRPPN